MSWACRGCGVATVGGLCGHYPKCIEMASRRPAEPMSDIKWTQEGDGPGWKSRHLESADKPLSDEELEQLRIEAPASYELIRLRARERKLVELCQRSREAINEEAWTVLDEELRAAIEENDDGK